MSASFLDHFGDVEDPRVPGMVLYPLDEILLTVLVGVLCRAEDFDEIEDVGVELLDWLGRILPFKQGVAPAQTSKRTLAPPWISRTVTTGGVWSSPHQHVQNSSPSTACRSTNGIPAPPRASTTPDSGLTTSSASATISEPPS